MQRKANQNNGNTLTFLLELDWIFPANADEVSKGRIQFITADQVKRTRFQVTCEYGRLYKRPCLRIKSIDSEHDVSFLISRDRDRLRNLLRDMVQARVGDIFIPNFRLDIINFGGTYNV